MARSKVELYEAIRRDRRLDPEVPIRELSRRHRVGRTTVRQALESAKPPPRKPGPRRARKIDPYVAIVDQWLIEDQGAWRKQRHTGRRVWQRLVREHGANISENTVTRYVAARRRELQMVDREVFISQLHLPGEEAEVDFGDVYLDYNGASTKFAMFEMRLSACGRSFHAIFTTCAQEAFIEGHVRAFEHFGGVPARIRYDNLKPAAVRVFKGRDRQESEQFILLRSHYGFESFFCIPGIKGAHEKGGVESGIGRFRRNHLVPIPAGATLQELNDLVAAGDRADDERIISGRTVTVGEAFAAEAPALQPLPAERFDATLLLNPKVDTRSRVCVRGTFYSVPVRLVGRRVHVKLGATTVTVLDGSKIVAVHERSVARSAEVLELDHYLETLLRKPGALAGSNVLAQAKASGVFTTAHQRYLDALKASRGDQAGTRAFVEVLLAYRNLGRDALITAMEVAVETGALDPQSVIIDARHLESRPTAPVIPIDSLARYDRPAPTLDHYDNLLTLPVRSAR